MSGSTRSGATPKTAAEAEEGRWSALVLAAGKGTRMNSDLAKVLHEIAGKTLLAHVLDLAAQLPLSRTLVVVGHQADEVIRRHGAAGAEMVLQEPQLGTGHAVLVAEQRLREDCGDSDSVLVLYGDVPLLRVTTVLELMERHRIDGNGVTVLTAEVPDPSGYGRILRDANGKFLDIKEDRDLDAGQRSITEINSGIYTFQLMPLLKALGRLKTNNAQGEYYLTDTLSLIREEGFEVGVFRIDDPEEISGVNTMDQLEEAATILERRRQSDPGACRVCGMLRDQPGSVIAERNGVRLMLSAEPYNSGHLWVVPVRHLVCAESLTSEETMDLFALAADAEEWTDDAYHPPGLNYGYTSGRQGDHLKLHVLPRWAGDANFMLTTAGVNILPETPAGTRRRLEEARARLQDARRRASRGTE